MPRSSKVLNIRGFGLGGLNTDSAPWDVPENTITRGLNFRIINGKLQSDGAFGVVENGLVWDRQEHMFFVQSAPNPTWVFCGKPNDAVHEINIRTSGENEDKIHSFAPTDTIDPLGWQHDFLGRVPIVNNPTNHPLFWPVQETGTNMLYLPWNRAGDTWEDAGMRCKSIRSFRNLLIAMNVTDTNGTTPDIVRWSTFADSGEVPPTWLATDDSSFANEVVLGGAGGGIQDGWRLRNDFAIYRDKGITMLNWTGANPYLFDIRHLSDTTAVANTNAIVEAKTFHFFIADGDVVMNDGNEIRSLMHNRIRREFSSGFREEDREKCFSAHHREAKELWFCIPHGNDLEDGTNNYCTRAYIYNYRDDTWAVRELPNIIHADWGIWKETGITWINAQGTWGEQTGTWGQGKTTAFDNQLMGLRRQPGDDNAPSEEGDQVVNLDQRGGSQYTSTIERIGYPLEGHRVVCSVQAVYPHIEGTSDVWIKIGMQDHAGATVKWKPEQRFRPGVDRKLDLRITGELFCFSLRSGGEYRLTGMDVEYVPAGMR